MEIGSRGHVTLGHTADVGVRATAPDPNGLLEEASAALAELGAEVNQPTELQSQAIEVHGDDLAALTYAWLNELVGLADVRGEALVGAKVQRLESNRGRWIARGIATFAAYDDGRVRPRLQVKAATFHRLKVTHDPEGWALEAYFDI